MDRDQAARLLQEWERQRGDAFRAHFGQSYGYLSGTIEELAADDATWTITPDRKGDHPVLLLAGETAFAVVAFSGQPEALTIKGALHPLDEGIIRVSFDDRFPGANEPSPGGPKPMIRRWSFDWHGRLQLPIEYWLSSSWVPGAVGPGEAARLHDDRQRDVAHKLARAAGWPIHINAGVAS